MTNSNRQSVKRLLPFVIFGMAALAGLLVIYLPNRPPSYPKSDNSTSTSEAPQESSDPSSATMLNAIAAGSKEFNAGRTTVQEVTQPAYNWFVVSLQSTAPNASDIAKAVLYRDVDGSLTLIAGPSTAFDAALLRQKNIPLAVQDELLTYEN